MYLKKTKFIILKNKGFIFLELLLFMFFLFIILQFTGNFIFRLKNEKYFKDTYIFRDIYSQRVFNMIGKKILFSGTRMGIYQENKTIWGTKNLTYLKTTSSSGNILMIFISNLSNDKYEVNIYQIINGRLLEKKGAFLKSTNNLLIDTETEYLLEEITGKFILKNNGVILIGDYYDEKIYEKW